VPEALAPLPGNGIAGTTIRRGRMPVGSRDYGTDSNCMAGEVFISYRRADQAKARLLHALLKQRGVDA